MLIIICLLEWFSIVSILISTIPSFVWLFQRERYPIFDLISFRLVAPSTGAFRALYFSPRCFFYFCLNNCKPLIVLALVMCVCLRPVESLNVVTKYCVTSQTLLNSDLRCLYTPLLLKPLSIVLKHSRIPPLALVPCPYRHNNQLS